MSLFSAQLYPGRALGFLVLGASLHDILTRLKSEPLKFPKLQLTYSGSSPVREPVIIGLPENGIRLQFDGPEQRLRLIEILDFSKNHIFLKPANDKERDLVRPPNTVPAPSQQAEPTAGPTFRHIYQRFLGPTYGGEFLATADDVNTGSGIYVLSYPGVAFTFSMRSSEYSPSKDVVSLLSSSTVPNSMAVFSGDSWAQARERLWSEVLPSIKTLVPLAKGKDIPPDEISLVKIYGGGKLQFFRKWTSNNFWITLGETTPQDLVAELGPPDAIYRKNDQRMYIHKLRAASNSMPATGPEDARRQDDLTDTDQSSAHTTSDDYDSDDEANEDVVASLSEECFYNYFYLGFDVLVSTPTSASPNPPSQPQGRAPPENPFRATSPDRQVATKIILHGNVPGSYPFNRHRRCRWEISYLDGTSPDPINSETPFPILEERLRREWQPTFSSEREGKEQQRGMVLNRGWGDSPGSSCEFLPGAMEESGPASMHKNGGHESTTTLYGFPGLVFEILKDGNVSTLTVF